MGFKENLLTAAGTAIGGVPGAIIGNAVGGLFGSIFGGNSAKKQFQYQSQLQQQQFDLQKQMFDYTSEYNSPVNAVQRYKDAGLNPNLLTGQTQNAGSTGSISQGNAPTPFVQMNGDLSSYIAQNNQSKLTDAKVRLDNTQADLNMFKQITEFYKGLSEKERARFAPEVQSFMRDLMEADVVKRRNEAIFIGEQTITEVAKRYNIEANTMKTIAQGINESLKPMEIFQSLKESNARISKMQFEKSYLSAAAEELKAKKELLGSEKEVQDIVSEIKGYERDNWKTITNAKLEEMGARVYNLMSEKNGGRLGPLEWNTTSRPKKDYTPYRVY